jgi:flagellar hook-length control protein FliK
MNATLGGDADPSSAPQPAGMQSQSVGGGRASPLLSTLIIASSLPDASASVLDQPQPEIASLLPAAPDPATAPAGAAIPYADVAGGSAGQQTNPKAPGQDGALALKLGKAHAAPAKALAAMLQTGLEAAPQTAPEPSQVGALAQLDFGLSAGEALAAAGGTAPPDQAEPVQEAALPAGSATSPIPASPLQVALLADAAAQHGAASQEGDMPLADRSRAEVPAPAGDRPAATARTGGSGFGEALDRIDPKMAIESAEAPAPAVLHMRPSTFAGLAATAPGTIATPMPHAQPTVAVQPGRFGHEMGVEIGRIAAAGRDEVTIRLNPIEMGRIEVRLSFDDRGSLRAVMAAESPAALDLLRRESADLNRALSDAGIRSDAQSFRFDNRSGSGGEGGELWQRQQQASQQNGRGASTTTSSTAEDPVYRPLRTSGQVDLMA